MEENSVYGLEVVVVAIWEEGLDLALPVEIESSTPYALKTVIL